MSAITFHTIAGLPKSVSPSSHATEADGFVYLTGQFGRDLADPDRPQIELDYLERLLKDY